MFLSLTQQSHQVQQLTVQHKVRSDRCMPICAKLNLFYPTATETVGTWHNMAIELTQEIDRRITMVTEDTKETTYLFQQRLSVAV